MAEALRGYPLYTKPKKKDTDDLPLGAKFKTTTSITPKVSKVKDEVNIELDNAGRVKSGKVGFALFIKSQGNKNKYRNNGMALRPRNYFSFNFQK